MLTLFVVDEKAEHRHQLAALISDHLATAHRKGILLPLLSVVPLGLEEIKFHAAPDLVIVGPGLIDAELTNLAAVRRILTNVPLLARLSASQEQLILIEQLARLGVDDVWSESQPSEEFLRKVILLSTRVQRERSGKLFLVDSGKGGLGVTSMAAALAEAIALRGQRTLLVDLDFDTQDLSRFLGVRPFVNENLQLLLDQQRPITKEFVEQCVVPVWSDEDLLWCMPPPIDGESFTASQTAQSRILLSVFETFDDLFDTVIVDVAGVRGTLLRTLCRIADSALMLISPDPASLYVSVDRLQRMRSALHPEADLFIVENSGNRSGRSSQLLRNEFFTAAKVIAEQQYLGELPFHSQAGRWPGSGATMYSSGSKRMAKLFELIVEQIRLVPPTLAQRRLPILTSALQSLLRRGEDRIEINQRATFALPSGANGKLIGEQTTRVLGLPGGEETASSDRTVTNSSGSVSKLFSPPVFDGDEVGDEKRTAAA